MPDPSKLAKQKEVGFKIVPTCGICRFAQIRGSGFGQCTKFPYQHQKHTEIKLMGIHSSGSCPEFLVNEKVEQILTDSGFVGSKELSQKQLS